MKTKQYSSANRALNKSALTLLMMLVLSIIKLQLFAQTLPAGFSRVTVASGMNTPIVMDFAPDGRIFVGQQGGDVRVIKDGTLLPTPFVQVDVNFTGERGLIGIVLDPNFASNGYVYLCYTLPNGTANRISRFTANGDVALAGSKTDILTLDPLSGATNHNGGAMKFKDGKLFVAVGENANGSLAQNLDTYHGKILRLNPDGTPAAGNPFPTGSVQRRSVWAYGLRNPFTFDVQPGTGRLFVNDVGGDFEEINDVTNPGGNYGWPTVPHGNSDNPAFTNPRYFYQRIGSGGNENQGCAITGGAFFNPTTTNYPAQYAGKYFFVDWCSSWINYIDPASGAKTNFATDNGSSVLGIDVGPDGNLYFLRRDGQLYKIIYTNNNAPAITNQPQSVTVSEGQPASFTVGSSGATPLNYQWQKNGVNIPGATSATYTIPGTTSSSAGQYRAIVTNTFGTATSNAATLTVTAFNAAPVAQIITPASGNTYAGGQVISFSGEGTDQEDGTLPASAFTWRLDFHHNTHVHPGPAVPQGVKSGSVTIPTEGETESTVWYRLYLTVTDSKGLTNTIYRDINPRTSVINFATQPAGLQTILDGLPITTPYNVTGVEGIKRTIGAVSPQTVGNVTYTFSQWLHGGTSTQDIFTPADDVTYTAVFTQTQTTSVILNPTKDAYVRDGAYAATNHGATDPTNLLTKNSGAVNNGYNRENYISFNTASATGTISSVQLKVFGNLGAAGAAIPVAIYPVTNSAWSETTINWNNKPVSGNTALATTNVTDAAGKYYTWDVTNYVKSEKAAGRNVVSFNMKNTTVSTPNTMWSSKEGTNAPQLVITFSSDTNNTNPPVADFSANTISACPASNITFTNASTGNITTYSWSFGTDATPSSATGAGPHTVSYATPGSKTVSLTATGPDGTDTETKLNYITITNCTSQSPYGGTVRNIPGKVEAEHYDLGGQGIAYNDLTAGNTGGVFRTDNVDIQVTTDAGGGYNTGWTGAGEWMEYTVNITAAGTYNFEARVATTMAARSMHIEMDGINVTGIIAVPNTGGWQTWQTVTVPNINLSAGQKIMRIVMETADINLNYINIVTVTSSQSPYGGTVRNIPGKIEAEHYDLGGQGIAYNDLTAGNTGGAFRTDNVDLEATTDAGGGYNVGWAGADEWLEYSVNVTTSASYSFEVRVATTLAGRTMRIEMDGINVTGAIAIPNTGGWQTWQSVTVPNISLTQGQKIMRVVFETNDFNINYISVTSSAPAAKLGITQENIAVIHPNPASGQISVTAEVQEVADVNIIISDIKGNTVLTKTYTGISGWFQEIINLSGLKPGNYILHFKAGEKSESQIIAIQ
ncbi:MAG: PQQ-dependent sugar dehydrogenase [Cytophagaceae bacterium]|nr:PQQ-dependent sugar dehydrogenase [Cytophagaceae bacterium]